MIACAACEIGGVGRRCGVALGLADMRSGVGDDAGLLETLFHLLFRDVYGGHDDMAGREVHELQDALAEVCLHDVDALVFEMFVEMALLREHRLALHHLLHLVAVQDVAHYGVVFVGVRRPVYVCAVGCRSLLELLEIVGEVCDGVFLDVAGSLAQLFPFRYVVCEAVAPLSDTPECLVVPADALGITVEFRCPF